MKRTSLSAKEYETMSRLSSVSEVAAFLKNNTRYAAVLKQADTDTIHRSTLESLLKGQLQYDLKALLSFSSPSAKFFLNIFDIKEEISNLKIFLRYLFTESIDLYKRENIFIFKTFSGLKNVNNFNEFAESMANTPYYKVFKPFINFPEKQNLFEIETALDAFYNRICRKYIKKYLSKNEAKAALYSFGIRTDLDTVMFIIRAKKYYSFSPKQIYPYITSRPCRLKEKDITAMVSSKTADEVISVLQNTAYKNIFSEDLRFFERNVHKYILENHRNLYRKNPYSIEAILCYISFKEIEIKNITAVIEGIRYGLAPENIREHLILI